MVVLMAVQLFTSRVVLNVLGIDDYGIWNLVATLIVSISFITGPLSSATQRFISFEIGGSNSTVRIQQVFSQSIILYILFGIILILILETFGLWFLNYKLVIPENKLFAANVVYQLSILSFFVTLIRMPYNSMIIAYEKMSFFAYVSIIEAVLRLLIVYILLVLPSYSHLILYGILTLGVSIVTSLIYKIYCNRIFTASRIVWEINKRTIKELGAFSGWSVFGAFGVMTANQGVNIVLNIFFGIVVNAAVGISTQVVNAVNQFISNFQIAFQPRLVKTYASGKQNELYALISLTSKISFFLIFMVAIPVIFNIHILLRVWLNEVPEYSAEFCNWMIVGLVIEAISAPLWMTVQATGNIRKYQLIMTVILLGNILGSYVFFKLGYSPVSSMWVRAGIAITCLVVRILFVNKLYKSFMSYYMISVMIPIIIVSVVGTLLYYSITILFSSISHELVTLAIYVISFILSFTLATYYILLNKDERKGLNRHVRIILQRIGCSDV